MSVISSDTPNLIDTHAHLDDPKFDKDIDDVIKRAKDAGLEYIVTVGCLRDKTDPCLKPAGTGLKKVIELTEKYEMVYASLGIHPHDAKNVSPSPYSSPHRGEGRVRGMFLDEIKELAKKNKVIAIGETGLDYHYDGTDKKIFKPYAINEHSPKNIQKDVFIKQVNIARELKLPLIIHSREAQNDTLDILKQENVRDIGGVLHCFSGTYEMAKKCLDMGLYISFTGVVTFPKAENIHELVKKIPIENMLIETDCPYLAPEPHRGKRNEPSYVKLVAERIAELKKLSYGDAARITTLNAKKLFSIGINKPEAKIAYPIRNSLYLNITNRCTNICTFCAKHAPAGFKRGSNDYMVKGHYLKLNAEPSPQEILRAIGPNPTKYDEIVFCGFGEPLIRLDVVKEVGLLLKKMGCKIRIDTDGLANLVHEKNCLPELMFVDVISVSMNAPDSETYQKLIKTPFKDKAFPAILWFLKEAKRYIPKVVATVVAAPNLDIEACKRLAEDEIGVGFRVREYNVVG